MSEPEGPTDDGGIGDGPTAAEVKLRSLRRHGVEYAFCNFGTDHPALLEAAAKVREEGDPDVRHLSARNRRARRRSRLRVGDGSYVFGQPSAAAWVAKAYDAPTLTVVYNNSGWNAVRGATLGQHPEGSASVAGVPDAKFDPTFDLSKPARVVGAHTSVVEIPDDLGPALEAAVDAVDGGVPAVVDVRIEPV